MYFSKIYLFQLQTCLYPELFLTACSRQEDWRWQNCGNIDILFRSVRHSNTPITPCMCISFVFFDIVDQIFYAGGPMRPLWFRFGSQIREIHKFSTIIIIMMEEIFFVRMPRFLWFALSLLTSRPPVIPDPCFYPQLFLIACSGQEDWCWQLCGNIDILFKSGRHFNASCKCKQFN